MCSSSELSVIVCKEKLYIFPYHLLSVEIERSRRAKNEQKTLVDVFIYTFFFLLNVNIAIENRLEHPCDGCEAPYGYRNHMNLSQATAEFSVRIAVKNSFTICFFLLSLRKQKKIIGI